MSALAPALFSEYREDTRWTEAREWHHLEQDWHQQEVDWRSVDVEWMGEQRRRMALEQDWRDMDMHQRWLDNLRREVDEKVQQLATLSNLSALLAGFAIVALVELSIPEETAVGVVIALACCTAIVVTATVLSMVTAAFVMVGLLKKYRGTKPLFEAAELGSDFQQFEQFWNENCQREYRRSLLLFTTAVPFFLTNLCLISFIKFDTWGAWVGIAASAVVGVGFIFWVKTNLTWVHFLTTEDGFTEYGLQPGSPGAAASPFRSSPQNSPRRGGGAAGGGGPGMSDATLVPARGAAAGAPGMASPVGGHCCGGRPPPAAPSPLWPPRSSSKTQQPSMPPTEPEPEPEPVRP